MLDSSSEMKFNTASFLRNRRLSSSVRSGGSLRMVLLGAPGSGKGTFAKLLSPHLNIPIISTGDLVRKEIADPASELGKQIKGLNDSGKLVPDEIVIKMTHEALKKFEHAGYILDGYPRNAVQAHTLEKFVEIDLVINLVIPEEILVLKTTSRRVCSQCGQGYNLANISHQDIVMLPLLPKVDGKCDRCNGALLLRSDDQEEVIRERLRVYNSETKPLVEFYQQRGLLQEFAIKRGVEDFPRLASLCQNFQFSSPKLKNSS